MAKSALKSTKPTDLIRGGKGRKLAPADADPKELKMGIKVEYEHLDPKIPTKKRKRMAMEIALDHLAEFGDYYTRLRKMEKQGEKAKKKGIKSAQAAKPGGRRKVREAIRDVLENGDEKKAKGKTPSAKAVKAFLKKNPNLSDDDFHDWCEKKGYNVHKAEEVAYRLAAKSEGMTLNTQPPRDPQPRTPMPGDWTLKDLDPTAFTDPVSPYKLSLLHQRELKRRKRKKRIRESIRRLVQDA